MNAPDSTRATGGIPLSKREPESRWPAAPPEWHARPFRFPTYISANEVALEAIARAPSARRHVRDVRVRLAAAGWLGENTHRAPLRTLSTDPTFFPNVPGR